MPLPIISEESIKINAKAIRELIKAEFGQDVSHGRCLKIVSQLFGFKNWNTAKAQIAKQPPTHSALSQPDEIVDAAEKGYSVWVEQPYSIDEVTHSGDLGFGRHHRDFGVDIAKHAVTKFDHESKTVRVLLPAVQLGMKDKDPKAGWERISEFSSSGDNIDGVWKHLKSLGGKYTSDELKKVFPKHFRKPWRDLLMGPPLGVRTTVNNTEKK